MSFILIEDKKKTKGDNMIPVYQPALLGNEKKYVNECLDTTWISSKGKFITQFENTFARYIGIKYASAVSNGTVAIHLAGAALGLQQGDEVICPTFTYIASANPFEQLGCKVVFCESRSDTWQLDAADVERRITDKTKAIIAVHLYGHPCDMPALVNLAQKYNLYLIEDCAEAVGCRINGQHVGTFGTIATFSFFGNKTITCGEGGMVVCNDETLHERVKHLKGQGVVTYREYWHDVSGYNYRMTNIQAAIGLGQLEQANTFIEKKQQIAQWYKEKLAGLPLVFHEALQNVNHTYWMVSFLAENKEKRDGLRKFLAENEIETRPVFPCIHKMPIYNKRYMHFPVAEDLSDRGFNLPSYPLLTEENVTFICNCIKKFYTVQ